MPYAFIHEFPDGTAMTAQQAAAGPGIPAVREYTQTKAIWVELTGGTRDPFTLG